MIEEHIVGFYQKSGVTSSSMVGAIARIALDPYIVVLWKGGRVHNEQPEA